MEYPLNIYITAHTLISSLGFGIPENLEAIHNYRSGIRMQEAGLISDHPLLAGMIDSVEMLVLFHISEPPRRAPILYAVFCFEKKKKKD